MATNWPNSVQTFTNPSAGDSLNSPSHSAQHTTVNDTVEALQNYAGLVFVKSQTIGSGVSSVTVSDAFSSTFLNYKVLIFYVDFTVQNVRFELQFNNVTTGYYGAMRYLSFTGANGTVLQNGGTEITVGNTTTFANMGVSMDIFNPYPAGYTMVTGQSVGGGYIEEFGANAGLGSNTGFTLFPSSGTMSGGVIKIYGYNDG